MTLTTVARARGRRSHSPKRSLEAARPLVERVRRAMADLQLVHRGERVVVGVSGGADSVALLHLLARLQPALHLKLYVVHVDHRLRSESSADAEFVQSLAQQLELPVVIERRDVEALCRKARWSLEDGARRIRYRCFLEAAQQYSAGVIALAHTADDQAETVLMRLVRGSGLTGLAGIPVQRRVGEVRLVRPLLRIWRHEVVEYLRDVGQSYRDDASNEDVRFVRNRLRHELLPLLERQYNPNIKAALVQLAEQSRTDSEYLQAAARRQWKRLTKSSRAGGVVLDIRALTHQPLALQRQLVREAIRYVQGDLNQFEFRHWLELERLLQPRSTHALVDLPGGLRVTREADRLIFRLADAAAPPQEPDESIATLADRRERQYTMNSLFTMTRQRP